MEDKSKKKKKRKEKRKGQRSGCTLLVALAVVLVFIVLVLLIRGPFTDKQVPATAFVLKLTPQITASPVYVPPTASATSPPVTVPHNQILYTQNDGQQIYAIAVDGSDIHPITKNTAAKSVSSSSLIEHIGQSSNEYIVFEIETFDGTGPRHSLYMINADGTNERKLADDSGWAISPAISPDGKLIAYVGQPDPSSLRQIYVMNADGSSPHNLTGSTSSNYNPEWASDGKRIRFVSNRDGARKFFWMDVDGSNVQVIPFEYVNNFNMSNYAWSPDSKHIAFSAQGGSYSQLFVADAGGADVHPLKGTLVSGTDPFVWSSDSKSVIFVVNKLITIPESVTNLYALSLSDGLWIINMDGTNLHQLLAGSHIGAPAWLP